MFGMIGIIILAIIAVIILIGEQIDEWFGEDADKNEVKED